MRVFFMLISTRCFIELFLAILTFDNHLSTSCAGWSGCGLAIMVGYPIRIACILGKDEQMNRISRN